VSPFEEGVVIMSRSDPSAEPRFVVTMLLWRRGGQASRSANDTHWQILRAHTSLRNARCAAGG